MTRRVWQVGVVLIAWCAWGGALAQTDGVASEGGEAGQAEDAVSPESVTAAQEARQHFERGMEHFQARQYRDAVHEFQLAARLVPSADLWFNIARAYEEIDDEQSLQQAVEFYRRYLRDRMDPPDRDQVEARIAALEERIEAARQARLRRPTTGTLRVRSNVPGAAVRVDSERLGETPVPAPIDLPPGSHRVDLEREGYIPFRSEVQIAAGVPTAAYADLAPATRYRAIRGRRIFTWIAGALGVAALATSVGFGIKARRSTADEDYDRGRQLARRSDYLLGTGIVLAVGAVILYFVEGRAIGTERIDAPPPAEPATAQVSARPTAF